MSQLLSTHGLKAWYGDFQALFGIDFEIRPQEIVAIIGSNGAGKSTFLNTVMGVLAADPASVRFKDQPIGGCKTHRIVAGGIAMVPEGRRLFPSLSVEENLRMGAYTKRPGPWDLKKIYRLFPVLKEKRSVPGTAISGGQQQMVAIGRALMSNPELLICDEISLGLAPAVIKEIYAALAEVARNGLTAIIVEQDVYTAQNMSQRLYCFQEGRVSLSGNSSDLTHEQISHAYFGV
ncbi:ABC transporter ATP-binding protein [Pollutimonas bauzanensis]|uniref:Branched-chain amino acid transport system ATP-binding protein n=1 Tax=Pollutimonas bauzanensis TaxID=658167 RepID=A0A1M5QGH2_9BURK|nr:ABC transporter ATP-binding protein [Pollutimonas bauzanensis]SHH12859.1 branched-chain amino acid transport system ATP-binding protein [Pollutimonas bauzanensis]